MPFGLSFFYLPKVYSPSSTTYTRFGVYAGSNAVVAGSAGSTAGTTTTSPCVGVEVRSDGSFYGFTFTGGSFTYYSLGYTTSDSGNNGGAMHAVDIFYDPISQAIEWWVQRSLMLRQTGLSLSTSYAPTNGWGLCQLTAGNTAGSTYPGDAIVQNAYLYFP